MPVVCCLVKIAQVYQARKNFEKAESYYQRALDIRTQLRGSAHPTVAWCKFALGRLYAQQRNYEQAEAIYQELGEQSPPNIAVLEASAALYVEQERYAGAEALIQQELATLQSVLEPTDYRVMTVSEHLVDIYMEQEKEAEAEALLRQLIDLRQQSLDKDAEEGVAIARNLLLLAEILTVKGEHEEAEALYRRTLAIVDKHEILERALLLRLLTSYALLLLQMVREEEAEQFMARAEAVDEEIEGHNAFWEGLQHYLNEGGIPGDDPIDSSS